MRIINKKYLLVILLIGIILTSVIIFKPNKKVQLDNVILKQEVNNKTFAMYTETDNGYEEYEGNKFPDMYVLNLSESKCIDNNGNELNGVLSYENNEVTITSGNTTYCYLYFDKSLGLEIKENNPQGLSVDIKGAMYRFQGPAKDESGKELVNNYICFGTSEKDACIKDPDHHMYRIIGIEASTGRVKVIKKETLNQRYQWWEDYDTDIDFPNSKIYEAIKGNGFLANIEYIPNGWIDKISDNTWMYGDMLSTHTMGARQIGEELYKVETGKKGTIWDEKAKAGDPGAISAVVGYPDSKYVGTTVYYIRHENEKWNKTFEGKVSLMYIHDYYYSVSDTANCMSEEKNYDVCKAGWIHLSNNDTGVPSSHEWTMSRVGWYIYPGWYSGLDVYNNGSTFDRYMNENASVRPVFYINASQTLASGSGTLENPFVIK